MKLLRTLLFFCLVFISEISFAQESLSGKYALGLSGLYVKHYYSYGEYYANLFLSRKRSEKAFYNFGFIYEKYSRGTIANTYGINLFYRAYLFPLHSAFPVKLSTALGIMGFYENSYERRYLFQKKNVTGYGFTGAFGPQTNLSRKVSIEANVEIQYGKGKLINYSGYNEFGLWSPRLDEWARIYFFLELKYQLGAK